MGVRERLAEDLQHVEQMWTKAHYRHPFNTCQYVSSTWRKLKKEGKSSTSIAKGAKKLALAP